MGWVQMGKKAGLGCVLGGKTGFGVTRKRGVHEEQCWNWCEQQVLLGCRDRRNTRETNWLDSWYVMGIGRACCVKWSSMLPLVGLTLNWSGIKERAYDIYCPPILQSRYILSCSPCYITILWHAKLHSPFISAYFLFTEIYRFLVILNLLWFIKVP